MLLPDFSVRRHPFDIAKRPMRANSAASLLAATLLAGLLLGLSAAQPARAAALADGQKMFAKCRICHTVKRGAASTVGPNLHGLFGRKAGSVGDFAYSAAMTASGVTWDDKTLAEYLRDPKAFIPGNHMAFPGIKGDEQLADLIAYLKVATK
jgi:cytochrome c